MVAEQLPFFVYGTLKPGYRNYAVHLYGMTSAEIPARLPGAVLYHDERLPFITLDALVALSTDEVRGYLIVVPNENYSAVLANLDRLEGYRPHGLDNWYEREVVRVEPLDGSAPQRAYTYVAGRRIRARIRSGRLHKSASGEWLP